MMLLSRAVHHKPARFCQALLLLGRVQDLYARVVSATWGWREQVAEVSSSRSPWTCSSASGHARGTKGEIQGAV